MERTCLKESPDGSPAGTEGKTIAKPKLSIPVRLFRPLRFRLKSLLKAKEREVACQGNGAVLGPGSASRLYFSSALACRIQPGAAVLHDFRGGPQVTAYITIFASFAGLSGIQEGAFCTLISFMMPEMRSAAFAIWSRQRAITEVLLAARDLSGDGSSSLVARRQRSRTSGSQ